MSLLELFTQTVFVIFVFHSDYTDPEDVQVSQYLWASRTRSDQFNRFPEMPLTRNAPKCRLSKAREKCKLPNRFEMEPDISPVYSVLLWFPRVRSWSVHSDRRKINRAEHNQSIDRSMNPCSWSVQTVWKKMNPAEDNRSVIQSVNRDSCTCINNIRF